MSDSLQKVEDDSIKLLVLQLLSEMATNYTEEISADCYDFSQIISLLSDENVPFLLKTGRSQKSVALPTSDIYQKVLKNR